MSIRELENKTKGLYSSAEQIGNHEDLLIEILVHLSLKSLIKFKVVCKQLSYLISSTSFCLYHTRGTKGTLNPSAFFISAFNLHSRFVNPNRFVPLSHDCVSLPPQKDSIKNGGRSLARVVDSCAGLLLYLISNIRSTVREVDGKRFYRTKEQRIYFIRNPTTRTMKELCFFNSNNGSKNLNRWRNTSVNLAFDPTKSPDYKIIYVKWKPIINGLDPPYILVDIETNSGRLSKLKLTCDNVAKKVNYEFGVFIKGAIYWPCDDKETYYFDVENECLKKMPMPVKNATISWMSMEGSRYFGECKGYLNLVVTDWDPPRPEFECNVFEMLEDRSDWYLKYSLNCDIPSDLCDLGRHQFSSSGLKLYCCIQYNSEEGGDSLFLEFPYGATCYNFKDGTLKRMHPTVYNWLVYRINDSFMCVAYQYIETLYPFADTANTIYDLKAYSLWAS